MLLNLFIIDNINIILLHFITSDYICFVIFNIFSVNVDDNVNSKFV